MKLKVFVLLFTLCLPLAARAQEDLTSVEVYIPEGMPIKLEVKPDDAEITKYKIKRIVGPEVKRVWLRVATLVEEDKINNTHGLLFDKGKLDTDSTYSTARVSDISEVAWAEQLKVKRLLIIVERIETDSGEWVLDQQSPILDIKTIIERKHDALPKGKFIPK